MLKDKVTVLAQSAVVGPDGKKLKPGKFYDFDDSNYLRIMVKSGLVVPVDPPSFDPIFLEKAGYELREGYRHPTKDELKKEESKVEEPKTKKQEKDSEEPVSDEEAPVEDENIEDVVKPGDPEAKDHAPEVKQLVPPVGMGAKKSEGE